MKILYQFLKWYYKEIPTIKEGETSNERVTGTPQLPIKYEINVSKDGKHVFATDSHIRNYRKEDIERIAELFHVRFPDCKIEVNAFSHRNPV